MANGKLLAGGIAAAFGIGVAVGVNVGNGGSGEVPREPIGCGDSFSFRTEDGDPHKETV